MGTVDFSGLKMKLIASIVAISAIALLKAFMQLAEGKEIADRHLAWLVGIHITFVVSEGLPGADGPLGQQDRQALGPFLQPQHRLAHGLHLYTATTACAS